MSKKRLRWDIWTGISLAVFLLVLLFLIYPLISLFFSAFHDPKTDELSLIISRSSSILSAKPPPVPPSVNAGRRTTG